MNYERGGIVMSEQERQKKIKEAYLLLLQIEAMLVKIDINLSA